MDTLYKYILPIKSLAIVCLLSISCNFGYSQNDAEAILLLDEVMNNVKDYHPISRQAEILILRADAEVLKAKGGFDPVVTQSLNQKYYDDKNYYSLFNGEIKIPLWPGIDIKTGYESNNGVFLGQENSTPNNGLIFGGVAIPLGQGLLIDERRADYKNAKIGQNLANAESQNLLNDLLFATTSIYWDWFKAHNVRKIFQASLVNVTARYEGVVFNAATGDRPQIDTVEAKILVQNIALGLNQSETEYRNISNLLASFMWTEDLTQDPKPLTSIPNEYLIEIENIAAESLTLPIDELAASHPYLEQLRQKIAQTTVEKRLKQDKLKPIINLHYNPLVEPIRGDLFSNYTINNYKWGVEFKMPLFLRRERGDIRLADLKIQEMNLELQFKSADLYNKMNAYIVQWENTLDQIKIFQEAVDLYEKMLISEQRLFEQGESSLFLVNSREQSYINAKVKLIELIAKNKMAYYALYYYAGRLVTL